MTDTNRYRVAGVKNTTFGVTPGLPRMRRMRIAGGGLSYQPVFVDSEEIRDDRMTADPIKVGEDVGGNLSVEFHYPMPNTLLSTHWESAMGNAWTQTPERDNDGVADAVITGVVAASQTVSVTTGAAFVIGHLVRQSGFGQAANNGSFRVTTGGATSYIALAQGMVDEPVPPAAARSKVVGFQGVAGDITATATGLGSTTLDFTTLGLQVGGAVKIGGTGAAFQFASAANNGWARVIGIAANALMLDNLPPGWGVDAGAGKTIRVFFGDTVKNGVAKIDMTLEDGWLGQAVPSYTGYVGQMVGQVDMNIAARTKISLGFTYLGLTGSIGTSPLSGSPDAAPDPALFPVFAGSANVGRLNEAGSRLTGPNWARSLRMQLNNNLRQRLAVDSITSVDTGIGEFSIGVTLECYFGDATLYQQVINGTPASVFCPLVKNSRAVVFSYPRLTPRQGMPMAQGKNQDGMVSLNMTASYDALTGAHLVLSRLEYVEA